MICTYCKSGSSILAGGCRWALQHLHKEAGGAKKDPNLHHALGPRKGPAILPCIGSTGLEDPAYITTEGLDVGTEELPISTCIGIAFSLYYRILGFFAGGGY